MAHPALIACDWGTTSLRAYAMGPAGELIASHESECGITSVADGQFESVLEDALEALGLSTQAASAPVLLSGMIGSRQGWMECPYADCPAGLAELANGLRHLDGGSAEKTRSGRAIHFVPGVSGRDADGIPDVMRGEETQLIGALGETETALAVLPGTHSKWVRWQHHRIEAFATFMTGEVYGALCGHTILGRLMTRSVAGDGSDGDAFARGVRQAMLPQTGRGGILKRIFSARTLCLFGEMDEADTGAYLSGLLIGTEVSEALTSYALEQVPVTVIGNDRLCQLYLEALELTGRAAHRGPADAAAAGLWRIACEAGLVSPSLPSGAAPGGKADG